jgi:hypothetical protein
MLFGKMSFKLSGTVGIVILLLGMTILFGTYQMSRVSNEIVIISEEYKPLQKILGEIRYHHANQIDNFEKLRFASESDKFDSDNAKEEFWSSNVIIKSNIQQGKKLIQTGYDVASTDPLGNTFKAIHQSFVGIEQTQDEFEILTREYLSSDQDNQFLLDHIAHQPILVSILSCQRNKHLAVNIEL